VETGGDRGESPNGDFDILSDRSEGGYHQLAIVFQMEAQPISARLLWDDYWAMHRQISRACGIAMDDLVGIHHVRSPPSDLEELELQAVIAQKSHEIFHGQGVVLALTDVELHSEEILTVPWTKRQMTKFIKHITRRGVTRILGVEGWCYDSKKPCIVWKNNEIWVQQDEVPRTLSHGDYIRCVIPGASDRKCMEDTLEVDQGLSLVQLHAATQTTSVDSTESNLMEDDVYGFGQDQICLEDVIPNTRNIRDALEAVWDIDIEEIAALHEVLEPPIRSQSFGLVFFLMEMRVDSRLTSRSDDVFGLVEVIIRGHQISGDSISKLLVTWLRRRARRIQLLSQLRLDGMCDNEDTFECKVYYNNILWPEADYALRQFQDGDLVWVEIHMNTMSARAAFSTLAEMENAERSRQLYGRGQAEQPDAEPTQVQERGVDPQMLLIIHAPVLRGTGLCGGRNLGPCRLDWIDLRRFWCWTQHQSWQQF